MSQFHIITGEIVVDDPWLPEPESVRGGEGPYIIPIVDRDYGGVIAWANTVQQAERIVAALSASEAYADTQAGAALSEQDEILDPEDDERELDGMSLQEQFYRYYPGGIDADPDGIPTTGTPILDWGTAKEAS